MTNKEKGQIFSLDFIIALGIVAMTIGMTLHFYELNVYEQKETTTRNELALIGVNASNLFIDGQRCSENPSDKPSNKGYELIGCTKSPGSITKAELMIPDGFKCSILLDSIVVPQCNDDPTGAKDIIVIQRSFLGRSGNVKLTDYESCLEGNTCGLYAQKTLAVKIWK